MSDMKSWRGAGARVIDTVWLPSRTQHVMRMRVHFVGSYMCDSGEFAWPENVNTRAGLSLSNARVGNVYSLIITPSIFEK
jgi:hypothetical protein